ncbi:MAG: KDO2-lipid IV(A) lauroyltransferase [Candidatus Azotimanducaceae bacterium]
MWTKSPEEIRKDIIQVTGLDKLAELQAENNALLFVIPHLGNWEYLNHVLGGAIDLTHMYQENKNRSTNRFIQNARSKSGTKFVKADRQGVKQLLGLLRNHKAIGLMPDQEPVNNTGSFETFFEQRALTGNLVPKLLAKTNAIPVLAHCTRRDKPAGFDITLEPIISDTALSAAKMNTSIENAIKQTPEQYLWSYKRFRTRPNGEPDFYQTRRSNILTLVSTSIEYYFMQLMLRTISYFSLSTIRSLAALVSKIALRKSKRIAEINLRLCKQAPALVQPAIIELAKTGLETGKIWFSSKKEFEGMYQCTQILPRDEAAIILTPPLGNRELVMRYLGGDFKTSEYFHPADRASINRLITEARNASGVSLLEHTIVGRQGLIKRLDKGQVISLCPDQQPRLRGGEFVPFFDCLALTTLALPELLKETQAKLYFGLAIRKTFQKNGIYHKNAFDLKFMPIDYNLQLSDQRLLESINQRLEEIVLITPSQYRWSDKRFNIRPPGHKKPY